MAGWLPAPVQLHSSREFDCEDLTPEQCSYYTRRWHFWYAADHVFALPTVAFFMCTIGVFIIGNLLSYTLRRCNGGPGSFVLRKVLALVRYLSYRGFHVEALRWNSAPVGLLVLAAVGTVFFFCMDLIPSPYYWSSEDYGNSPPLGTRSGWMALACMPFVFATASKVNWITLLTGVSHEKLQMFHRWISYAFFILALMHTFPFIVYHIRFHDMVEQVTQSNPFKYWTGIVAIVFQAWLTFASFSTIRNLGYEFFKAAHFLAVVVFMLIFFWHCGYTLTSWDYFIATAALYIPCLVYPWLRTLFEYGTAQRAKIHLEDNGFIRISVPAKFDWVPGQHCFLRFRNFGLHALTSHPFTLCSLPSTGPNKQSEAVFYIRHRGGFTAKLHDYAITQPDLSVPLLVDGPYGGINPNRFYSSDRLLVIAGGSGAGWSLPFIEQFIRCAHFATDVERGQGNEKDPHRPHHRSARPLGLLVILATRDTATRVWFRRKVNDLLTKYPSSHSSSPDVDVQVYLTGEAEEHLDSPVGLSDSEESESVSSKSRQPSAPDQSEKTTAQVASHAAGRELQGRPPLPQIVHEEAAKALETEQSLGVFVCGPDTMQNDVRNAVAKENLEALTAARPGSVYLHMEHFSWA